VRVYGADVAVNAKIFTLGGFSAHADRNGLLEWVKNIKNPKLNVFVVHGETTSAHSFADTLKSELGLNAYVPQWGESIDLSTMKSELATYKKIEPSPVLDRELDTLSQSLKVLMDKYAKVKNTKDLGTLRKIQDDIQDVKEMLKMIIDEM
jgi:metallo-beta-lactamase family protein